jgi:hypothetical protein
MRYSSEQAATPEEAAALVVAMAKNCGLASPSEIEDQSAVLLSAFAVERPDHPVARYFDLADDAEIEAFFVAVTHHARSVRLGAAPFTIDLFLN